MSNLLKVEDLQARIDTPSGRLFPVDRLSFSIRSGETFALVGESGCGKSMTALSIMRLLPEVAHIVGGLIELDGVNLLSLSESEMRAQRGRRVGIIFQDPGLSLNPVMTIGKQIAEAVLSASTSGVANNYVHDKVMSLLQDVQMPNPEQCVHEYPFQLSGGMKQRAMIAMALAGDPLLLIADEPTTALDVTVQKQILQLLKRLQRARDMAILLITHDLGVVAEVADHIAVMYAGQIIETSTVADFFKQPHHPYSQKLFKSLPDRARHDQQLAVIPGAVPDLSQDFIGCRFVERCDHHQERCFQQLPLLLATNESRQVRCHFWKDTVVCSSIMPCPALDDGKHLVITQSTENLVPAPPLLQVKQLKLYYPRYGGLFRREIGVMKAVEDVSLTVAQGQTLGLVGESGCGKSSLGKAILRLLKPTAGQVVFNGMDVAQIAASDMPSFRQQAQIIFQDPFASLNPRIRIGEILAEGIESLKIIHSGDLQDRVEQLLHMVGLEPSAKVRYPHEFSGGQRQRIAIARVLSVNPSLIVCDEPTSALDVSVQAQILNLLRQLQSEKQLTYVFISHNISVVRYMADEIAVMYLGRIVERGATASVLSSPKHPYTQTLLAAVPAAYPAQQLFDKAVDTLHLAHSDMRLPAGKSAGCAFYSRCTFARAECSQLQPVERKVNVHHTVNCHLY